MSTNAHRRLMASPRIPRSNRVGVIASVTPSDRTCSVIVQDGEILAFLTDQTIDWAMVGATAILQRVGDTYFVAATVGGTGAGGVGESLGPELLSNPEFEFGPGGAWGGPTGWTIEWNYDSDEPLPFHWDTNPADALAGNGCVKVTATPGVWTPTLNVVPQTPVMVDEGSTYRLSAWVKADVTGQGLAVTLRSYTADTAENCYAFGTGRSQLDHATVTDPGAAYQLLTGTFTVPAGHNYARIVLRSLAPSGASVNAFWDKASLRQRITS